MNGHYQIRLRADVRIEPLSLAHADNMYRWMCDPVVSVNLGLRGEPSTARTIDWIERALADKTIRPFAVTLNDRHVGNVILDRIDDHLSCARLSVYLGESDARGIGVATTALYRLLEDGFVRLGLHKIWLTVHSRNYAAVDTYTRLGFALEGILRDEFVIDGHRLNALYLAVLESDFNNLSVVEDTSPQPPS